MPAGQHLGDVPEGGDPVVAPVRDGVEELGRAAHGADVHLAAGLLHERLHPVDARVVTAGLGVAGEGDEVEPALAVLRVEAALVPARSRTTASSRAARSTAHTVVDGLRLVGVADSWWLSRDLFMQAPSRCIPMVPTTRDRGKIMARTPLASQLQRAAADGEPRLTRRRLLQSGAAAALGAGFLGVRIPQARGATAPKIVVVGAGLAGLTCAYRLKQAGYAAELHEASTRVGGRCWTIRDAFQQGQIAEHGGELIDTRHRELRNLVKELGLTTVDLLAAEAGGDRGELLLRRGAIHGRAGDKRLPGGEAEAAEDLSGASYPTLYSSYTQRGWELDHMSIVDWIQESVPGGMASKLGQLLDVAYNIEYGAESSKQSALNLVYLLGYATGGPFARLRPVGRALPRRRRERPGGDEARSAARHAARHELGALRDRTHLGWAAEGLVPGGLLDADDHGGQGRPCAPFSLLRPVDYSTAGFSPVKQTAIKELQMGTNSKLQLQFKKRLWETLGSTGTTYADTGYQSTWDVTRGQSGSAGILVDYTGGKSARASGRAPSSSAQQSSSVRSRPSCRGSPSSGTAWRRSTTGRGTRGRKARTPTGASASTRSSSGPSASSRATATSRASTPRSTSRAT